MHLPLPLKAALLAATLALAGCHAVRTLIPPNLRAPAKTEDALKEAQQRLKQATPCCSSFADFSYQTTLPFRPKKFDLGRNSPVVNLNGTHSYFLAFRLPQDSKLPYRIALKAELNGRWLHNSYLFAPTVVVLDGGFQPLSSHDVQLCEYMGWSSTGAYGSATIDNPKAHYLVIYSSAAQQKGSTYWEQSPAAFSANSPVSMTSKGSFRIAHGPDGTLWVGIMNESYADAQSSAVCGKPPAGKGLLHDLPLPWNGS